MTYEKLQKMCEIPIQWCIYCICFTENYLKIVPFDGERVYHSRNCGVKITPPVYIEDHTMHFTPVLNLWCSAPSCVILTPLVVILTLIDVMFKL